MVRHPADRLPLSVAFVPATLSGTARTKRESQRINRRPILPMLRAGGADVFNGWSDSVFGCRRLWVDNLYGKGVESHLLEI
jgi:hypothetical protein